MTYYTQGGPNHGHPYTNTESTRNLGNKATFDGAFFDPCIVCNGRILSGPVRRIRSTPTIRHAHNACLNPAPRPQT